MNVSAKFALGRIVATPGALAVAEEHGLDILGMLRRHAHGDWGDLDAHDKQANEAALKTGARIFSAYGRGPDKLWVITDAARQEERPLRREVTTILRPEDY